MKEVNRSVIVVRAKEPFLQWLNSVSEEIITLSRGAELANISLSDFKEEVRAAV